MDHSEFKSRTGLVNIDDILKIEGKCEQLLEKVNKLSIRVLSKHAQSESAFELTKTKFKDLLWNRLSKIFGIIDRLAELGVESTGIETIPFRIDELYLERMKVHYWKRILKNIPPLYPESYPQINPAYQTK